MQSPYTVPNTALDNPNRFTNAILDSICNSTTPPATSILNYDLAAVSKSLIEAAEAYVAKHPEKMNGELTDYDKEELKKMFDTELAQKTTSPVPNTKTDLDILQTEVEKYFTYPHEHIKVDGNEITPAIEQMNRNFAGSLDSDARRVPSEKKEEYIKMFYTPHASPKALAEQAALAAEQAKTAAEQAAAALAAEQAKTAAEQAAAALVAAQAALVAEQAKTAALEEQAKAAAEAALTPAQKKAAAAEAKAAEGGTTLTPEQVAAKAKAALTPEQAEAAAEAEAKAAQAKAKATGTQTKVTVHSGHTAEQEKIRLFIEALRDKDKDITPAEILEKLIAGNQELKTSTIDANLTKEQINFRSQIELWRLSGCSKEDVLIHGIPGNLHNLCKGLSKEQLEKEIEIVEKTYKTPQEEKKAADKAADKTAEPSAEKSLISVTGPDKEFAKQLAEQIKKWQDEGKTTKDIVDALKKEYGDKIKITGFETTHDNKEINMGGETLKDKKKSNGIDAAADSPTTGATTPPGTALQPLTTDKAMTPEAAAEDRAAARATTPPPGAHTVISIKNVENNNFDAPAISGGRSQGQSQGV